LTEEEMNQAINSAKRAKEGRLKLEEHWKKVNSKPEVLDYNQSVKYFISRAKYLLGTQFKLTKEQQPIFEQLVNHSLSNLNKGILLAGPVGCGKTTLMKIFSENQKSSYAVVPCKKISSLFVSDGFDIIEVNSDPFKVSANMFRQNVYGACFDDLGTEEMRVHFGNKVNTMQDIILNRYERVEHGYTHFTTNLIVDQIKDIYGERAYSRLKEMVVMISFNKNTTDLRK